MKNKPRILVVEDDNFIAKSYKRKLEEEGFEVMLASDGEQALLAIENDGINLVILDLIMPVMDGFQFLETLKEKKIKTAPILALTNLNEGDAKDRALELGVKKYLVKANLSLNDLLAQIHQSIATA